MNVLVEGRGFAPSGGDGDGGTDGSEDTSELLVVEAGVGEMVESMGATLASLLLDPALAIRIISRARVKPRPSKSSSSICVPTDAVGVHTKYVVSISETCSWGLLPSSLRRIV